MNWTLVRQAGLSAVRRLGDSFQAEIEGRHGQQSVSQCQADSQSPHHVKVSLTICSTASLIERVALKWALTHGAHMVLNVDEDDREEQQNVNILTRRCTYGVEKKNKETNGRGFHSVESVEITGENADTRLKHNHTMILFKWNETNNGHKQKSKHNCQSTVTHFLNICISKDVISQQDIYFKIKGNSQHLGFLNLKKRLIQIHSNRAFCYVKNV